MFKKLLIKVVFLTTFLFSSQLFAVTAADIENANPKGQTVEFWVQYSDAVSYTHLTLPTKA